MLMTNGREFRKVRKRWNAEIVCEAPINENRYRLALGFAYHHPVAKYAFVPPSKEDPIFRHAEQRGKKRESVNFSIGRRLTFSNTNCMETKDCNGQKVSIFSFTAKLRLTVSFCYPSSSKI
ncbi:hypothetical protein AVEN_143318-1 [Araneus ventricosus]|uniref:Uncharacterized protein n=1 Tax=Araneus ventricosus TaxID=182803 RepID=A0A4Y2AE65_ARAVE|nr:hypothetical protein AVEN_143318-1 [Araneus ventricosus]